MKKTVLLIDNEKQDTNEEKIVRLGKNKKLRIETYQFNVGNQELTEVLSNGKIDLEKVIDFYKRELKKFHFDLIAFDWSLDDPDVDGIKLIQHFRSNNLLRKTNIVLYSGELRDAVKSYFEAYKNNPDSFKENWAKIKTLIDVPILGFYDRLNYEEKIVEELGNISKDLNIEGQLIENLRKNGDCIFDNSIPKFFGLSFGEVADIIENDITRGHQFTSEILEQILALLLELKK